LNPARAYEAPDVVNVLSRITKKRGAPKRIYCDNGSEFCGRLVDLWTYANSVTLEFSRPGKPTDNAFIESFNGNLRDECLNVHWFDDLTDAKEKLQAWRRKYNESRPHRSLDDLSPWNLRPAGSKTGQKFADDLVRKKGALQSEGPPKLSVARVGENGHLNYQVTTLSADSIYELLLFSLISSATTIRSTCPLVGILKLMRCD